VRADLEQPTFSAARCRSRDKNWLIADMAAAGMLGIEVDHRDHDDAARRELRGLASDLGLVVTGSSDYHGAGKPNLIGENRTEPEAFEAIVAAAVGSAYLPP
jgi:3',5'-nucleoside bisphosphate phosphatase